MLGREQSGEVLFKIADLTRDADLLPKAHAQAQALLGSSLVRQQALLNRWLKFPPMKMQA
jgi:ATP-dependent DNA helicase RecG